MNPVIDAIHLRSKPVSPLKSWVFATISLALLPLAGCLPSSEASKPGITGAQNPGPQSFDKPIIAQAALPAGDKKNDLVPKTLPLATVPVKGLLQSTSSTQRTQQASMNLGRDPFSALPPASLSLPSVSATTPAPVPVLPKSAVGQKQTAQKGATRPAKGQKPVSGPSLPQLRPVNRPANLPTIPVRNNLPIIAPPPLALAPPAPVVSPTELAEQVEVTGVVQVGMRSMAIVQAPGEGSARHVSAGDRLSGGRVVVREIRVSPSGQPTVVLEQNGQTIVKAIGASRMASARSI